MIGPVPWLPAWFTAPIPAARLYALRVGVAALVLFDVVFLYLADYSALFGASGYTTPEVMAPFFAPDRAVWSLFRWLPPSLWIGVFLIWALAAAGALVGIAPRVCIIVAWICATSALNANPDMHSGGDRLRGVLLFTLIFSPLPTRQDVRAGRLASGWPAKLLLFQLAVVYFFAGAYKLRHPAWQDGTAMYFVLNNSTWCLTPKFFSIQIPGVMIFCKALSWLTVIWEMSFMILVLIPWARWRLGLGVGIAFHILCLLLLQTSTFPLYSLACYLPLLPWERWLRPRE